MALSPEQSKAFHDYEEMFMTEGWRSLVKDMKQNYEDLFPQLLNAKTAEELHFLKGRAEVFQTLVNLEDTVRQIKEMAESE